MARPWKPNPRICRNGPRSHGIRPCRWAGAITRGEVVAGWCRRRSALRCGPARRDGQSRAGRAQSPGERRLRRRSEKRERRSREEWADGTASSAARCRAAPAGPAQRAGRATKPGDGPRQPRRSWSLRPQPARTGCQRLGEPVGWPGSVPVRSRRRKGAASFCLKPRCRDPSQLLSYCSCRRRVSPPRPLLLSRSECRLGGAGAALHGTASTYSTSSTIERGASHARHGTDDSGGGG